MQRKQPSAGFTLIELSIVLVIIGLVVSGVFVGRELIVAAEIRKQATRPAEVLSLMATFRDRYRCLPGDCPIAERLFGSDPDDPDVGCELGGQSLFPGTCNGTGSGVIGDDDYVVEPIYFFQHMNLAGIGKFNWGIDFTAQPKDSILRSWQTPNAFDYLAYPFWTVLPSQPPNVWVVSAYETDQSAAIVGQLDRKYDDGEGFAGGIKILPNGVLPMQPTTCVDGAGTYRLSGQTMRNCLIVFDLPL